LKRRSGLPAIGNERCCQRQRRNNVQHDHAFIALDISLGGLSHGCSLSEPWHLAIWAGEQFLGLSIRFPGFWHGAFSSQHTMLFLSPSLSSLGARQERNSCNRPGSTANGRRTFLLSQQQSLRTNAFAGTTR
jgi:hypothetical protein